MDSKYYSIEGWHAKKKQINKQKKKISFYLFVDVDSIQARKIDKCFNLGAHWHLTIGLQMFEPTSSNSFHLVCEKNKKRGHKQEKRKGIQFRKQQTGHKNIKEKDRKKMILTRFLFLE